MGRWLMSLLGALGGWLVTFRSRWGGQLRRGFVATTRFWEDRLAHAGGEGVLFRETTDLPEQLGAGRRSVGRELDVVR
jgi:hypothetical protein